MKMKAWQWPDPTGIGIRESHYVRDEQEMINATFSDGAHGNGGYQRFCSAKGVREPSRLNGLGNEIDFSSAFLTANLNAIYILFLIST